MVISHKAKIEFGPIFESIDLGFPIVSFKFN
jgi:hypothetical protein